MKRSTFSIIIPVRNSERYLRRCLDSIIGQTFRNFEVLCVYDASSDDSLEILKEYMYRDPRICLIDEAPGGLSEARNLGVAKAKGTFLIFVDADDELFPQALERILPCFGENTDIVCFGVEEVAVHDNGERSVIRSGYFDIRFEGLRRMGNYEVFHTSWTVWNKAFRKSMITTYRISFPEKCHYEDNLFTLNSFVVSRNVFFIKDILYQYNRHKSSLSYNDNLGKNRSAFHYITIIQYMYDFWREYAVLPRESKLFQDLCVRLFRSAIQVCLPYEKAGIVWELSQILHSWNIPLENSFLIQIRDGNYSIYLGSGISITNIEHMKKLNGLQKILYIGNIKDNKVLMIFGLCIFKWKRV